MNAARLGRHGGKIAFFWRHASTGAGITNPSTVNITFFDEKNNAASHSIELEEVSDGLFYLNVPASDTGYRYLIGRVTSSTSGASVVPFYIEFEE